MLFLGIPLQCLMFEFGAECQLSLETRNAYPVFGKYLNLISHGLSPSPLPGRPPSLSFIFFRLFHWSVVCKHVP